MLRCLGAGCCCAWRPGLALAVLALALAGCGETGPAAVPAPPGRIAFGSCASQAKPQPIWRAIAAARPDLVLLLGDNIYADTTDMAVMRSKYERFGAVPEFAALRARTPVLATWDDHDYGQNDAGSEYPMRQQSQAEFLHFFQVPADDPRWQREGVYQAWSYGPEEQRLQVILLDTRYFRTPHRKHPAHGDKSRPAAERDALPRYEMQDSSTATVLGEMQWAWLEKRLREPARLRMIGTSIQALHPGHRFESWAVFPRERLRLLQLIRNTGASGVLLLSGDRHHAELACLPATAPEGPGYPLYEATSSGLNQGLKREIVEANPLRIGEPFSGNNFGLVVIDWDAPDPRITLQIRDEAGAVVNETSFALSALRRGS